MTLVVVDTSVWQRRLQTGIGDALGDAIEADAVAMVDPIELELLRSAWGSKDHDQIREEYSALHRISLDAEIGARAHRLHGAWIVSFSERALQKLLDETGA